MSALETLISPVTADSATPLLQVRALTVEIATPGGVVRALDRLDLDLLAGETYALLGESGCGKSMTALSLMRLLPSGGAITAGEVRLDGRDLCALPEGQMRRVRGGELAMIFQEPGTSLNPVLTVGTQIGEAIGLHRSLKGEAAREQALALLRAVGIADPQRRLGEYPFQLSGGMKQRVMIAIALAGQPRLLIADEPTTALDVTIQAQVLDLMAELQRERGMGMLLITHDLGVVARMAHRVGVMYAGEMIETAPRAQFFAAPAHPYSRMLFRALPEGHHGGGAGATELATIPGAVPPLTRRFRGCRFVDRCPQAHARCHDEPPAWYPAGPAQHVRCHLFDPSSTTRLTELAAPPAAPAGSEGEARPLLEVHELQVHFPIRRGLLQRVVGQVRAVDGVSLCLRAGRTLALVGESGCGKTTTGKALLNLIGATGGSLTYEGRPLPLDDRAAWRAMRAHIQMVFQDPQSSLNPRMRVREILAEGLESLGIVRSRAELETRVPELLQQVGLRPDMADRYPHEFSGGQRQRIALARALSVRPKVVVCDEPTSALDVSVQAQILNLMRRLQHELGLSYLFITHNIGVVDYLADEVAVMYLGRIVEQGPAQSVLREPRHPYTQALLAAVPSVAEARSAARSGVQTALRGDLPSPSNPPVGCHFHPRCAQASESCRSSYPTAHTVATAHIVRCHLYRPS